MLEYPFFFRRLDIDATHKQNPKMKPMTQAAIIQPSNPAKLIILLLSLFCLVYMVVNLSGYD